MDPSSDHSGHTPVLVDTVLELLDPQPGQTVLDCTIGRGGHAARIMPLLAPGGRYVGLDVDPENLEFVRAAHPDPPVELDLVRANFADAPAVLAELGGVGVGRVDGVLADPGFSSHQMRSARRGLSFRVEGPLDMRMDPSLTTTAADLVHSLPERELADLIYHYGEERRSRRIARKIVETRRRSPMNSTTELAKICRWAYGGKGKGGGRGRIDPATRTFQALRIAVNHELERLETLLQAIPQLLNEQGRAVVISFHSLEDRRVKLAFRELGGSGQAQVLTRKPLQAAEYERERNPRSRSAKCRAVRMIGRNENP